MQFLSLIVENGGTNHDVHKNETPLLRTCKGKTVEKNSQTHAINEIDGLAFKIPLKNNNNEFVIDTNYFPCDMAPSTKMATG